MSREALLAARSTPGGEERLASLRTAVREGAENRPGVYQMAGHDGAVVYVGKSKRLRARLLGYFRCAPEEKGARILRETSRVAGPAAPATAPVSLHEVDEILLLSSWFQRFPEELARTQPA
jgi:excinuclease ABC subunit C